MHGNTPIGREPGVRVPLPVHATMPAPALVRLAADLAEKLAEWHRHGGLHGALCPAAVLVDAAGDPVLTRPEVSPATLRTYAAPEQTGRLWRGVDERADLYSLGALLYQLASGRLPTAAVPRPRAGGTPGNGSGSGLPAVFDEILRQLVAARPEDRYQSARGLAVDLRRCRDELRATGRIERFLLGGRDVRPEPLFSGRLYGRKERLTRLSTARDRVATAGGVELVAVTAEAGLGKTALLGAFTDEVILDGGRAARTSFSAFDTAPYAGIVRLLFDLVGRAVVSEGGRQRWRERVVEALGSVADALVTLAPEFGPLLDLEADDTGAADAAAARGRLYLAVRRLLSAHACAERPLVLALDDVQHADAASLDLLRYVVSDPRSHHLLVAVAYRPKEASGDHPLTAVLRAAGARRPVTTVPLRPLPDAALADLLADALRAPQRDSAELARIVAGKTRSNPLVVGEFLRGLHATQLLVFDDSGPAWQWELERIRKTDAVTDVAAAVRARVARRPPGVRSLLHTAAVLGDAFDAPTLAAVAGRRPEEIRTQVQAAVREQLLTVQTWPAPAEEAGYATGYRFSHEVARRGAAADATAADLRRIRLAAGRALGGSGAVGRPERVYAAAAQLGAAAELLVSDDDRAELAEANLAAGRLAARTGALAAARRHLQIAVDALPPGAWTQRPGLARAGHLDLAAVALDAGDPAAAVPLLDAALRQGGTALERAALLRLRARQHRAQGDDDRASATTLRALAQLGVAVTRADDRARAEAVARAVADHGIEECAAVPAATDPAVRLAAEIIADALDPLTMATDRCARLAEAGVRLALERGPTPASAVAFASHAAVLADRAAGVDDRAAAQVARTALRLLGTLPGRGYAARVEPVAALVRSLWYDPDAGALDRLDHAYRAGVEDGALDQAIANRVQYVAHRVALGLPLDAAADEVAAVWRLIDRHGAGATTRVLTRALGEAVGRLRGQVSPAPPPAGTEDEVAVEINGGRRGFASTLSLTVSLAAAYLAGNHACALEMARTVAGTAGGRGSFLAAVAGFYHALALAAAHDDADGDDRPAIVAELGRWQGLLDEWASHGPRPFAAMAQLVAAERARLAGAGDQARYEHAIDTAREHGLSPVEGAAAELGGRYALARGDAVRAGAYLRRARACYERWRAPALVARIDELLAAAAEPAHPGRALDQLDLLSVVRAFQAISAELGLDRLVVTLLRLLVQHAHAERGALLLPDIGGLRIAAVAETDRGQVSVVPDPGAPLHEQVPIAVVDHVYRTRQTVRGEPGDLPVLATRDPYLRRHRPRALLCTAITRDDELIAVLYLEHRRSPASFTPDYLELLEVLCAQAAIALENAKVHAQLLEVNRILDATFDRLPAGLILLGPDLKVRRASPRALQVTGLPIRPGTPLVELFDVLTPMDAGATPYRQEPGFAAIGPHSEPIERDIPIIAPTGERRVLRTSAIPLRDERSVLVGVTLLVSESS